MFTKLTLFVLVVQPHNECRSAALPQSGLPSAVILKHRPAEMCGCSFRSSLPAAWSPPLRLILTLTPSLSLFLDSVPY